MGIYISVAPLGEICYCLSININITTSIYPLYHSYIVSVLAGHVHQEKWATSQENMSSVFRTRFDTNRAVQPQKMARGLKFQIYEVHVEGLYCLQEKTKGLISCTVTIQLICALFSHTQKACFLITLFKSS